MQNRALMILAMLLMLGMSAPTAAQSTPASQKPDVLFIVVDDLRADVLSVYGGAVDVPHLEDLAARGCVFERATCGYPICHVSRAEMLTGRYLVAEGVARSPIAFDPAWALWPEVMQNAGWQTVYSGKWHVRGEPWSMGYDHTDALYSGGGSEGSKLSFSQSATGRAVTGYTGWTFKTNDKQPLVELGVGLTPETDRVIADGAIRAIRQANAPLFLHVNFTAPHDPLHWPAGLESNDHADDVRLPRNFAAAHPFDHGNQEGRDEMIVPAPRSREEVREEWAVYQALAQNLDVQVGRILAACRQRGRFGNTIVIFTSDQGLALGSHGLMGKQNQYEHTANVPLIVAGPGIDKSKRLKTQCALRDLFPTICELNEIPVPASVQGKSLMPVLQGEQSEVHGAVYGYFTDTQRMIRTEDGWKLIWYPQIDRVQLFHLNTDPSELIDLSSASSHAERRDQLLRVLRTWLRAHGDPVVADLK